MKRKTDNFSKFINRKSPGAVKEEIRQEKKLMKKERKEGIEKHFEEKRNKRAVAISLKDGSNSNASGSDRGAKSNAADPHRIAMKSGRGNSQGTDTQTNAPDKSVYTQKASEPITGATLPLNKFVAHAGVSSRRAAAALVKEGKV